MIIIIHIYMKPLRFSKSINEHRCHACICTPNLCYPFSHNFPSCCIGKQLDLGSLCHWGLQQLSLSPQTTTDLSVKEPHTLCQWWSQLMAFHKVNTALLSPFPNLELPFHFLRSRAATLHPANVFEPTCLRSSFPIEVSL